MIYELHVKDLALIEEAWLELGPGLTVLSGETGAGKTVLLSALKLLMGERSDGLSIRHGKESALVEAQFDDDCVVSRTISLTGRNKVLVNSALANVSALADAVGWRIDLHGQHDHQKILKAASHREFIDAWGDSELATLLSQYQTTREYYANAKLLLEQARTRVHQSSEEVEIARLVVAEIERIAPVDGEDDELAARLPVLQHAEELARATAEASAALRNDDGATDSIAQAMHLLKKVESFDSELAEMAKQLEDALAVAEDVGRSLKEYSSKTDFDGQELELVLARLSALESLKKRFGPTLSRVLEKRSELQTIIDTVSAGPEALEELQREVEWTQKALMQAGDELHTKRVHVAAEFGLKVLDAMTGLDMGPIRFEVLTELLPFERWNAQGPSAIEFMYAPSPHGEVRPLVKIGSGGEASRVMLAIKSVLGEADSVPTLVFDEIDAGVGGATASSVGLRLAQLAKTHQVIVVTHLAQVAAFANAHFVVRKLDYDGELATVVVPVEGNARIDEIARMLSGVTNDVALEHARELLTGAQQMLGAPIS